MSKHVILILEYDMGDYSDVEEDGDQISIDPEHYLESFHQGDILTCDMKITGVRIEEKRCLELTT